MSEPRFVRVEILNYRDGESTQARSCILHEPGMTTIWDFKLPVASDYIGVKIERPKEKIGEVVT